MIISPSRAIPFLDVSYNNGRKASGKRLWVGQFGIEGSGGTLCVEHTTCMLTPALSKRFLVSWGEALRHYCRFPWNHGGPWAEAVQEWHWCPTSQTRISLQWKSIKQLLAFKAILTSVPCFLFYVAVAEDISLMKQHCTMTISLLTNKYDIKTISLSQSELLNPGTWQCHSLLGCCKLCLARCTDGLPKEALGHLRLTHPLGSAEVGVNVKIGAVNHTERDYLR